jgi:predicted heme/steroid binding protein
MPIENINLIDVAKASDLSAHEARVDNPHSVTAAQIGAEQVANKGQANGYAPLNGSSQIPQQYLPSFVDDVLEFANLAAFPGTGETGKIYVAIDTGRQYRWSGSAYIQITNGLIASTDDLPEGTNNKYSTNSRVLNYVLTGLSAAVRRFVIR